MLHVISLGGSIIAPDNVDTDFCRSFFDTIVAYLQKDDQHKVIIVCGGGAPARRYQKAYRDLSSSPEATLQDWIGIAATRLNGELLRAVFSEYTENGLVSDPNADFTFTGRVLLAAGWKPGFSTDYDAVLLAKRFSADTVINLSNVKKVYTDDPKKNPNAKAIDSISWNDFLPIVGDEWVPGKNVPFDPVAAREAAKSGLRVVFAGGRDLANLEKILEGKPFYGTTILA